MKIKIVFTIQIVFISLLIYLISMLLRARGLGGFQVSSIFGFIAFIYLTMFCLNVYKYKLPALLVLVSVFIGLWCLELPLRITNFYETLVSLPDILLQTLGVVCGFFYVRSKKYFSFVSLFLSCVIAIFMFFQGWDYWIHRINFGTFTGKIAAFKLQQNIEGIDEKNNSITNKILENKIVLLDFWHTKCGVCFQKFPQLQAFYDKYKDDNLIAIYAVDKPIEEDKEKSAFKVIEEEGYSFPVLLPTDEELPDRFGVFRFPATFVLDRKGNVVYKGDIEGAIILVEELKRQE
jgi:thiol-disulfide isomerase/thioredoxin